MVPATVACIPPEAVTAHASASLSAAAASKHVTTRGRSAARHAGSSADPRGFRRETAMGAPDADAAEAPRPPCYGGEDSPALRLEIHATWNKARASTLHLPHHAALTPMFMPVGTQASVKGIESGQLLDPAVDAQVVLGNTYHLGLRPGGELVDTMGGLHSFMNWPRGILTDSGGFQMVSLVKFSSVSEAGVHFQSPVDGTDLLLTPEHSIKLQNQLGADIIMQLDDVVASTTTGPRVEEACHRTLRWMDRCIAAHAKPQTQNLFGIVQGGLDSRLRELCCKGLVERNLPGYAVGGLSGGEEKDIFWKVVDQCTDILPESKPRYCMGVGYPLDLVVCVALGADMFDCVYPARTARFGTALVPSGQLKLRWNRMATDHRPIEDGCECYTCRNYSRAYLHALSRNETVGAQLLTLHNVAYLTRLMKRARTAIIDGEFPNFVRDFALALHPDREYPAWARDALKKAGVELA